MRHLVHNFKRGVAQPGSAPALGAGGRRFKSSRPEKLVLLKVDAKSKLFRGKI